MSKENSNETEEIIDTILDTFQKKRDEKGLSNTDLAKYLNMTSQNVGDIFKKKIRLRLEVMLPLMKLLEIETFFVEKSEVNKKIELLQALLNKKDELLPLAEMFLELGKEIKDFFKPIQDSEQSKKLQINMKATEEQKDIIKNYVDEKGLNYAEGYVELIKKEKGKK